MTLSAISFPPSANSNTKIFWYLQYKDVCQSKQFCFLTPIHDLPSSQEDKPLKLAPLSEQRAWPTQQKTSTPGSKNIHNVNFTSSSLFFSDGSKIIDDYISIVSRICLQIMQNLQTHQALSQLRSDCGAFSSCFQFKRFPLSIMCQVFALLQNANPC